MDHSYTRQSKLIKAINLAVWAVLFLAGITLCQRVYSERQGARQALAIADAGDVAAADHASAVAEDLGNDSEASSIDDEQATTPNESETVKEQVAETVVEKEKPKVASTKPTIPHFKPPPRRKARKTTPKKTAKPKSIDLVDTPKTTASKPAVLATSPITSHTSDDVPSKDIPKESGLDEVTPSTSKITKSLPSQPSIADTATKTQMPKRVPKTTKRESNTTAQSSISLTPPLSTKANKAKVVVEDVATAKEPSATQKTASKLASQKTETKTVKTEPKKTKTRVEKKTTPKRNPLQLVIENPKKIGYPVSFLIGDEQKTLQPGEKLERILSTRGSTANVHFDRGGDFGEAILNLKPADYEFKVTREGWNIVPQETAE